MSNRRRLIKMVSRMIAFGVLLGAVAGFLVGWTMLVMMSGVSISEIFTDIIGVTTLSAFFGGSFGAMFGGISGLISGVGMALVTAIAFGEIRDVKHFKIAMGITTAVITTGVFMVGEFLSLEPGVEMTLVGAMVMSIVIAVYASQITAKKYLNELNLRKKKVEA